MTSEQIITNLSSKKSNDRRRAAKEIGMQGIKDLGEDLFSAYLKETNDRRTWETQVEMIRALGLIEYQQCMRTIENIVEENISHSRISNVAAQSYVRLKRKSLEDIQPIIELLEIGGLSIVDGALNPLAYDSMIPKNEDIQILLDLAWDLQNHPDRIGYEYGYCDPRYGIVAACGIWPRHLTLPFLEHCIATGHNDVSVMKVAEKILRNKPFKLR